MKKTISIHIAGRAFFIEEEAYENLQAYQQKLENWFRKRESGAEIIEDIEARMSELFAAQTPANGVITADKVREVIETMGQPEDFSEAEEEKAGDTEGARESTSSQLPLRIRKRFFRNIDDKVFGGVCSGLAAYLNMNTLLVRIIFVLLPFFSVGAVFPVYLVLWLVVPAARTTAQKLEMRGENVTVSNIERMIREQYEKVRAKF